MRKKNTLVYGVGINDADYAVKPMINGKQVICHFYRTWKSMLGRCYSKKYQDSYPSYIGCTVCEEWLTFSKFKEWMENQDWHGKHLDKDLLVLGNKFYSSSTCIFVEAIVNTFIAGSVENQPDSMLGFLHLKSNQKYQAYCRNPITRKIENLSSFNSKVEAYQAWRKRKHELACQLAEAQIDHRVAIALRLRYNQA